MAGLWRLIIDLHADKQKERTQLMEPGSSISKTEYIVVNVGNSDSPRLVCARIANLNGSSGVLTLDNCR